MIRLHRLSLLFVRVGLAAVAFAFVGGFSFGCGGVISAIIVRIAIAVFTTSDPKEAIDAAFTSHPWGLAAWLVVAGEGVALVVAAYLAWRLSGRLFQALPDPPRRVVPILPAFPRRYTLLSLGAFLLLEGTLNALSLPSAIKPAFAAHPWGLAARLVVAGEGVALAAYFAWRLSGRLFQALPDPPRRVVMTLPAVPRRYALLSLVAFLLLEGILNGLSLPSAIKLAREYRTVTGRIRGIYPQEHGTVTYTYLAEGRRFDDRGSPENLAILQPGSAVQVYYAPSKPELNSLHEPQRRAIDTLLSNMMAGLFISIAPLGLMAVQKLVKERLAVERLGKSRP